MDSRNGDKAKGYFLVTPKTGNMSQQRLCEGASVGSRELAIRAQNVAASPCSWAGKDSGPSSSPRPEVRETAANAIFPEAEGELRSVRPLNHER